MRAGWEEMRKMNGAPGDGTVISIIVPVHNAEPYLEYCIRSVLGQSLRDLEILLVECGSEDRSPEMCDRLSETDPRIRVIHTSFCRPGEARNRGIDCSHGRYLMFADADDYLHPQMAERLLYAAEKSGADLVQCDYRTVFTDMENPERFPEERYAEPPVIEEEPSVGERILLRGVQDEVCWNKLFRADLIGEHRFPEDVLFEDRELLLKLRYYAEKIVYVPEKLYFYVQTPGSVTRGKTDEFEIRSRLLVMRRNMDFCKEKGLVQNASRLKAGQIWSCVRVLHGTIHEPAFRHYYRECMAILRQTAEEWDADRYSRRLYRWMMRGMRICPELTVRCVLLWDRIKGRTR